MRTLATKARAINQYNGLGNQLWDLAGNRPSLDLRFADDKSLVDATTGTNLVDHTRASSGTYVDSQGVIRTATTNLLLQSEDFSTIWSNLATTETINATAAPNGTVSADEIIEDTSTTSHYINQQFTSVSGLTYTYSCYVKAANRAFCFLIANGTGTLHAVSVNLTTGVASSAVGSPSNIISTAVGNGWYRVSFTYTSGTAGAVGHEIRLSADGVWANRSYTGNGTGSVYAWGAQLEQSSTVGEYIKTTSTINSAPRFDHDPTTGESLGLLVEESRTNNVLQSEDFATTWTASNLTVTTNSVVAPDGTTTADTIAPPTDGLTVTRFLRQNPALTTQQAYTFSVFIKIGTATTNGIALYVSDGPATNSFRANFNLFNLNTSSGATGWATPTATIIPYPNGWYRCILSGVTSTAHTVLRAIIYLNAFGTTADDHGSIHVWGAQLEAGSFPTSYIPTEGTTVTRAADVASISGSNFSSWYRQDEGTVFAEGSSQITTNTGGGWLVINDNSIQNRIDIRQRRLDPIVTSNGVNVSWSSTVAGQPAISEGSFYSQALSYKSADHAYSISGGLSVSTTPTVAINATRLALCVRDSQTAPVITGGTFKRLTYWPQRLPNETLQGITK